MRNRKGLYHQTYEGLKITVHSVIELVKFLIMHKVSYVLVERFCQDPLENYFGKQRSSGALLPSMTSAIIFLVMFLWKPCRLVSIT